MIQAWNLSQDYHLRPSQLYNIAPLVEGYGCSPEWLEFQFDSAIGYFGRWFDNRVQETDAKGHRRWNPDDLLKDIQPSGIEAFEHAVNTIGARGALATSIRRNPQT